MIVCQNVPKSLIDEVWPRVAHWIDAAIKRDRWWTQDLLRRELKSNDNAALFLLIDKHGFYGATIAKVEQNPTGEIELQIPACGGREFSAWRHHLEQIEEWARSKGATMSRIEGRLGWQRVLARDGYKRHAIILEKQL